ncbi:MAG: polyprenyl synthetase family protein [Dehalococcoidales bacterium]|nr:polyprenyl synthetase family protein [Dehalococcoidales bacterium]MDP7286251.1 polyprenyl synthetase family protein [Dehalococcoidales bacterium]MDP7415560.1 polyprenyl synthetase family protein [Dehalococcoidales bacterium]
MELIHIYKAIQDDLAKVKGNLTSVSRIDFDWLSEQLNYVVRSSGKGIRPALTLLAGKFYHYNRQHLLPMAAAVELMHTATLVHDDAIDKSVTRRGKPTIFQIWGGETAILLGDYLFAKAGESVADTQSPRVIKLFSQTLATISSGELSQLCTAFKLKQTRQQYFQKIAGKTASLFSLATESGAILSKAPEKSVRALKEYGHNLGIAFQIVDDILDFTSTEEKLGKPIGSDLAQGTLTLPAMLLLERYPEDNPISRLFQNQDRDRQKNIAQTIELIRSSSIDQECYEVAAEYCAKATHSLTELPEDASHRALVNLTNYILSREN